MFIMRIVNLSKLMDTNLEDIEELTYLGSVVNVYGGTDADVKTRINKSRVIFNILVKVWSVNISRRTKTKILKCKVCAPVRDRNMENNKGCKIKNTMIH